MISDDRFPLTGMVQSDVRDVIQALSSSDTPFHMTCTGTDTIGDEGHEVVWGLAKQACQSDG